MRKEKSQSTLVENDVDVNFNFEITSDEEELVESDHRIDQNIECNIKIMLKNLLLKKYFFKSRRPRKGVKRSYETLKKF